MIGPQREAVARGARLFALQDVTPSLNVYCKHTRIRQYLKENSALRTETTINNTYDFGIGRKLRNLPKLLEVGFAVNRRLLEIECLSHDLYEGCGVSGA